MGVTMARKNGLLEIKRKTLFEHVLEQLVEYVINSRLKPGDKLPTEYQLASQLGVSRGTIREVMAALTFTGIIEVRPKTGTRMLVPSSELRRSPYNISRSGTKEKIEEFVELRIALEQAIAELAAKKASRSEITKLKKCVDSAMHIPLDSFDELQKADLSFHFALAEASRNSSLQRYLAGLRNLIKMWMKQTYSAYMKESFSIPLSQHKKILKAIEAHDTEKARLAMARHLHSASARLNMAMLKKDMENQA